MSIKLKPCPFCGDIPELIFKSGAWGYSQNTVSVGCYRCGFRFIEVAEKWIQGKGTFSIRDEAEARLIERWNTRSLTCTTEENDLEAAHDL